MGYLIGGIVVIGLLVLAVIGTGGIAFLVTLPALFPALVLWHLAKAMRARVDG